MRHKAHLLKLHGCRLEVALEGSLPVTGSPAAIIGAGPEFPLDPAAPAIVTLKEVAYASAGAQGSTTLWTGPLAGACQTRDRPGSVESGSISGLHCGQAGREHGACLSSGWATASVQSSSTTRLAASGLARKASSSSPTPCLRRGSQVHGDAGPKLDCPGMQGMAEKSGARSTCSFLKVLRAVPRSSASPCKDRLPGKARTFCTSAQGMLTSFFSLAISGLSSGLLIVSSPSTTLSMTRTALAPASCAFQACRTEDSGGRSVGTVGALISHGHLYLLDKVAVAPARQHNERQVLISALLLEVREGLTPISVVWELHQLR